MTFSANSGSRSVSRGRVSSKISGKKRFRIKLLLDRACRHNRAGVRSTWIFRCAGRAGIQPGSDRSSVVNVSPPLVSASGMENVIPTINSPPSTLQSVSTVPFPSESVRLVNPVHEWPCPAELPALRYVRQCAHQAKVTPRGHQHYGLPQLAKIA